MSLMSLQFPVESLTIRPAEVADLDWAADLVFAAGPGLFSYVFALKPDEARVVFRQAFAESEHAFSYQHVQVLEVADRPAGLVLSYSGKIMHHAEAQMQKVMAHLLPLSRVPRILVNFADLSRIKQEVPIEDYYVLSVCVDPAFQSKGLGTVLLREIEMQAKEQGCAHLCLDVPYSNTAAQRWLQRLGYKITCSKTSHRFETMTDAGGLHRMMR
jgi:ribosomal protein S18 acetylase RimI-like enzyme